MSMATDVGPLPTAFTLVQTCPQGKTIVCGVNSAEELLARGENENCRVFEVADGK